MCIEVGKVGVVSHDWYMVENTERKVEKRTISGLVDTFRHILDPKKRLTVPSEWRDALGNPTYVYVMPSATEECLELIPVELMERIQQQYLNADLFDDEADAEAQAIAQFAQMLKVDAAGRIRIGDDLLAHAGISSGVTMIGGIRKAKLWATERMPAPKRGRLDLAAFRAVAAKRKMLSQAVKGVS